MPNIVRIDVSNMSVTELEQTIKNWGNDMSLNERPSITLVRVTKRTKEKYGMYAADWYVCGYDANNKYYEGWESDFLYEKRGDGIR